MGRLKPAPAYSVMGVRRGRLQAAQKYGGFDQ